MTENDLVKGKDYLYWSMSKQKQISVSYIGRRKFGNKMPFVFRNKNTYDEIWTETLVNIVIDNGRFEKFVNEKEDDND